ncbi:MAG: hypothetical protein GY940_16070, partial [bacterium]|nr:hypothetical protein [bacterium]
MALFDKNSKQDKEAELHEQFKTLVLDKRFMELANLITIRNQTPPEYVVRLGFKSYMQGQRSNRVRLFFVMKLKEITSIVPEDTILENIVRISFEMNSPHILDSLCKRLEIEKNVFKAMDDELQEAYLGHVKKGVFANVEKLMEITGIEPSETIIQRGYKYYLEEGKVISFTGLKNKTNIKPDKKMMLEIFKLYQENANKFEIENKGKPGSNIWKKRIERLRKAMGSN